MKIYKLCRIFNKSFVCPMGPGLNDAVQKFSRTFGGAQLSMSIKFVVRIELLEAYTFFQKELASTKLLLRWPYSNEGANEGDANGIDVIALGMSTLGIPAATLIDESIATNEKIIANMIPIPAIHVKALHNADTSLTDIP